MVIPSLGGSRIIRIVRIIVVWTVLKVRSVQSFRPQRSAQVLVRESQRTKSMHWIKQLRRHNHGDREITSELIVGPLPSATGTEYILVDPSTVDKPGGNLILGIFSRI